MVDVNFNVVERPAGSFTIGAGFSSSQGLLFNINLNLENLLGTGNRLQLAFDNSSTNKQLSISHTNPYYTDDGVSRTFSAFARETDTSNLSDTSDYFADSFGASVRYGIPLSEFGTLRLGAGAEGTDVETTDGTPDHINEFVDEFGNRYGIFQLTGSYTHDTRNRTVFAERGAKHQISAELPIPGGDLEYFRLGYDYEVYHPVTERTVFSLSTEVNYGDGYGDFDELPFFKKYFAGGVRSVRGYDAFSLGPRDSNDNARGGDFKTTGTAEIIFPPPLNTESGSTRFSLFVDFGNVFADVNDFDESELRSSAGVSFIWLSPVGPLTFSLAEALNAKSGDDTESFQFTIGALF
jgi:outer membrane protein insertion porin family